jgi:hypothetical protein
VRVRPGRPVESVQRVIERGAAIASAKGDDPLWQGVRSRVEHDEEVDGSVAAVLVIVALKLARLGGDGLTHLADELDGGLVETDHLAAAGLPRQLDHDEERKDCGQTGMRRRAG